MRALNPDEQAKWITPARQSAPGEAGQPLALEGLARLVASILEKRIGVENALGRNRILQLIREMPIYRKTSDRQLRSALEELRGAGILVCNMSSGGGYFLAANEREYLAFKNLYLAHCTSMLESLKKMDQTAKKKWGSLALQDRLL